jgi:hypothetical protein
LILLLPPLAALDATVILAAGAGKRAAEAIHADLNGEGE